MPEDGKEFGLVLIEGMSHSLTADRRREFHSTCQELRVDTNGYNLEQMDYHSNFQHEHHPGMPPWV